LKYFKRFGHNVLLITNAGDSFDRLRDNNIPYITLPNLNSKNPFSFARNISAINKLIKEFDIDIIHSHHRYAELIALQSFKPVKHDIKTVSTSLSIVNRRYNIEYRSDVIIAVSNTIKNMLESKFRINTDKIKLIHNFTDTEELHEIEVIAHNPRDHGSTFNILSVGRFHPEKNFEVLFNALKLLSDPGIKLILIGEGVKKEQYLNLINTNRINAELITPKRDLLEYFFVADICVLPSARDPFPNFMLQAGLHKKPFIGAEVDGIKELIVNGSNGMLFESGNPKQLAHKINLLKDNLSLRQHLADNLYEVVINNYTQEFIIPMIEKLYFELKSA
jgi:glycosyltransferase involved in cell wall biosynthesis